MEAGEVCGWSWLFPPYHWHFDARAVEPTEAIFFYGTRLREQCENDHDLGYELMKRMASVIIRRLQTTRRHLLAWAAEEDMLLHGAHFPWPGLGRVHREETGFHWDPIDQPQADPERS